MRHPHTDTWVTPCNRCGSLDFDIKPHRDGPFGLIRYCLPCKRRNDLEHRSRNIEARRLKDKLRKRRKRAAQTTTSCV